jgi:Trehalose-phosphatase
MQLDWNKGNALLHLLEAMGLGDPSEVFALYIGDDRTDEDAFQGVCWVGVGGMSRCCHMPQGPRSTRPMRCRVAAVLEERGLGKGILVSTFAKPTAASWVLHAPDNVVAFLEKLVAWGQTGGDGRAHAHAAGPTPGWVACWRANQPLPNQGPLPHALLCRCQCMARPPLLPGLAHRSSPQLGGEQLQRNRRPPDARGACKCRTARGRRTWSCAVDSAVPAPPHPTLPALAFLFSVTPPLLPLPTALPTGSGMTERL